MTREQAKSELMQIYMSLSEEKKQALDVLMAQADGEYISRKALLEDLYKRDYTKFTHRDFVALVQYQDIVAIPNKTEPKTGHWEWVQYDSNPNIGNWHCSECNRIVCGAITAANSVYAYKYCPNCGAKMD